MAISSKDNHHPPPPTNAPPSADGNNSPNFNRKPFPSPWAKVVRGGAEMETTINQSAPSSSSSSSSLTSGPADQPPSSDCSPKAISTVDNSNTLSSVVDSSEVNAGRSKKPAWKKPSNGVAETGPIMGAEKWPALSLTPNKPASGKFPVEPESSSKTVADGSHSTSQEIVPSHSPKKQGATSNVKSNSAPNYNVTNRQRPTRRVGGSNIGSGPIHRNFSIPPPPPPPPPPPFPVYQIASVSYGNMVPSIPSPSPRDHYRNNNWDPRPPGAFVPTMNERGSSRRGNFGSHPRDGSHHNNYGSRRDQDRGNYVNNRDAHVPQPRMLPRGVFRPPPPNTAAFVGPQPVGPFPPPIGYPELYYIPTVAMDPYSGMQFFPPTPSPAAYIPPAENPAESPAENPAENPLSTMIMDQINYYFSDANLVKDTFLRANMDEQGWVLITLIANFPRVKKLTSDYQLIVDSLRTSSVVEMQGDKLRKRREWMKYPSLARADSGSVSPSGSRYNNLTEDFQSVTVEETIKAEGA